MSGLREGNGRRGQNRLWVAACLLAVAAPILSLLPAVLPIFSTPQLPTLPRSSDLQSSYSVSTGFNPAVVLAGSGVLAGVLSLFLAAAAWWREGPTHCRPLLTLLYLLPILLTLALLLNVLGIF